MGQWDGLKDAQIHDKGSYFPANFKGTVKIKKLFIKHTLEKGDAFIAELEVVTTNMPEALPVGTQRSWYQSLTKKTVAFGAIKEFMAYVHKYDLTNETRKEAFKRELEPNMEGYLTSAVDEARNPYAGQLVGLETFIKQTKEKKSDFTVHRWSVAA